jgi:o-succinylbenzoate---CoA ligase
VQNPVVNLTSVNNRPLHAVQLGAAGLLGPLAAALDGTGPALLPLDPRLPPARLALLLDELAPDAVLGPDGKLRRGPAERPGGVAGDTALVIATSGSTGRPKGVELPAAALLHSARASLARIGATGGERWLCCLPASHIAGLQVLIRSLVAGTEPVIAERLDPATAVRGGAAFVSLVPTQLARLLAAGVRLGPYRKILLGGAGAPARMLADARAAGGDVVTTYGMSETCGGCVYDGVPLAGVRAAIGAGGRIRLAGPVLFAGYRGQPGLTAEALDGGWFTTSDLGELDGAGRLTVRGRADDMINTGGEKVIAGEVAATLLTCDGVRDAVVVGRPDPEWGQRVTAVVVPADPAHPPSLDELRAHVRRTLPAAAAPREVQIVAEIPLLASGKPDLATLAGAGR